MNSLPLVLGVLASHQGSTLQAVIDACADGSLHARIGLVISNNKDSGALARAEAAAIPHLHLSTVTAGDEATRDDQIRDELLARGVQLVLLAGYMKKLGEAVIAAFPHRILNTHPALLPNFGGQGMYGDRVHRAVLEAGVEQTGVTLHLVDSEYDRGPIVAQAQVPVAADDRVETLSERVKAREKQLLLQQLRRIALNPELLK